MTPVLAERQVRIGEIDSRDRHGRVPPRRVSSRPTRRSINVTGQPAISLPLFEDEGLPVPVQLIGRPADEAGAAGALGADRARAAVGGPRAPRSTISSGRLSRPRARRASAWAARRGARASAVPVGEVIGLPSARPRPTWRTPRSRPEPARRRKRLHERHRDVHDQPAPRRTSAARGGRSPRRTACRGPASSKRADAAAVSARRARPSRSRRRPRPRSAGSSALPSPATGIDREQQRQAAQEREERVPGRVDDRGRERRCAGPPRRSTACSASAFARKKRARERSTPTWPRRRRSARRPRAPPRGPSATWPRR